ncbi:nucleotidyltransferase domain-containing protein [Nostoc sp. FACHB-87]|uniref:type VII toxin-antitoxin system MntA family adenylyltransferase antitoxin n=1 Tax=Nostocaceae TaxID=1162 RepID=UPI0016885791|nr:MULTISPECIES: nucleotidyltransferase domain-containing protein [Nostocaceae]MBD2454640.1 nucleotidyltransferase domain-containing protein [Nostoc sp. FACHB-87]MBD2476315.1 nucleotidyltransferase domain-containing protein [Anabaena sp. FACHB-83]
MENNTPTIAELQELALQIPEKIPYLKMLVLFGSRATGNTHAKSDWDFAVLCDQEQREAYVKDNGFRWFELPIFIGEMFKINSDQIDVVDLNQCSALISHFIARDGKLLYEDNPEEFEKFKQRMLLSNSELKKIENTKRQNIEQFLQRWGV